MSKFKILIEETIVQEFEIDAKNEREALLLAKKKYNEGEFVLDQGEVQYKQMAVATDKDYYDWFEF